MEQQKQSFAGEQREPISERRPVFCPERRNDPRYSVDEDALLQIMGHGAPVPASIVDLSQEGCRVRTKEQVFVRARWPVEVTFKVHGVAFRFSAVVEWTDDPQNLLGMRFVNMIPRRMVELAGVICEMQAAAARRAKAVNQLVAEEQAPAAERQEVKVWVHDEPRQDQPHEELPHRGQGIADRRVGGPAGEEFDAPQDPSSPVAPELSAESELVAPVPAPVAPEVAEASLPRDRRAQSRHEVDTSAVILLVKIASALRGRIIDLSLGGCRIRTDEKFPVGIYTRVEIEFRLEGIPFRLGGVIQAIHNRQTVGIRFLDLSDRKRQQVADLICEIEEMRATQPDSEFQDHHI